MRVSVRVGARTTSFDVDVLYVLRLIKGLITAVLIAREVLAETRVR